MTKIKLVHPKHGVISEKVKQGKYTKKIIIRSFRTTYGNKVNDCKIEITKENINTKFR